MPTCGNCNQHHDHSSDVRRCYGLDAHSSDIQILARTVDDGTYTIEFEDGSYRTLRVRPADWATDLPPNSKAIEYLSGPDNETDFTAFGFIVKGKLRVWRRYRDARTVVQAAEALLAGDDERRETYGVAYALRSERCRRCNRTLTVNTSIHQGYGPDCIKLVMV